ncbi:MAG: aminotransferase class I/II-fold pyridoxal phosphate-dependent enzyme [Desulforhopalus sp.]|nr:aminotransferase class I/II-fold pyridoxal phosphate-dependent enzyme [Desulforhopalus sp.]
MKTIPNGLPQDSASHWVPEVHLNLNVRGLKPSATVAINERSNKLLASGREIFKMGLGQSPFPVPEIVVEQLKKYAHEKDYLAVQGHWQLREAVCEHHRRTLNIDCDPKNIIIGPGSKELMFILQLVYYGDLLIPTPAWVSYAPQAQIIGRHIDFLPTKAKDGWRLTGDQLERLCQKDPGRPRILILNYPSNPTGMTYSAEHLREIAEVAKKYRIIILSDEIYGKLHHAGTHASITQFYPEGTIFSGGLSKWCGAGGWRLGLFVFPENLSWLLNAMTVVASETFTSTSAPIQYAAITAFKEHEEIEQYLHHSRRVLAGLGKHLASMLQKVNVQVLSPEGGFYLFPDFESYRPMLQAKGISTSVELCDQLLEDTGVAILPGVDFGQPPEELTARMAYVNFNGSKVLEQAFKLKDNATIDEQFLQRNCHEPLQAVERICDWLDAL